MLVTGSVDGFIEVRVYKRMRFMCGFVEDGLECVAPGVLRQLHARHRQPGRVHRGEDALARQSVVEVFGVRVCSDGPMLVTSSVDGLAELCAPISTCMWRVRDAGNERHRIPDKQEHSSCACKSLWVSRRLPVGSAAFLSPLIL